MATVKRICEHKVRVGGEQHSVWLPEDASVPLPIPVREVAFNIEIDSTESGYLLCYASVDGELYGDTWHETLSDAEQAARDLFGVTPEQWQNDI